MVNEEPYKVLWIDDDTSIIQGFQNIAENYNIDLCHETNWETAEILLKEKSEDYSAIIFDAECKISANDPEECGFLHKVLPSLYELFGKKQIRIPWYVLSAGTMDGFCSVMDTAQYRRSENEEEWGKMVYSKTAPSQNENSREKLFENIQKNASNQTSNIVLFRYHDVFQYLGEGKLIGREARTIMLKMLCNLHTPEQNTHFDFQGNPLRKVMEHIFRAAHEIGLLPDECIEKAGQINILDANRFMSGITTSHSKLRYGKEGDYKKGIDGDTIFPNYMGNITRNILNFASTNSHTSESNEYTIKDKDLIIDENEKELFFGYVLQLCHVIKFFGHFAEQHPNKEENLKMIKKVCHN